MFSMRSIGNTFDMHILHADRHLGAIKMFCLPFGELSSLYTVNRADTHFTFSIIKLSGQYYHDSLGW